jgi:hypothetical protein
MIEKLQLKKWIVPIFSDSLEDVKGKFKRLPIHKKQW